LALRPFGVAARVSAARLSPAPVFCHYQRQGGVGKTNIVANLATAITKMKKRVMAIDANLGLANLDLFLGVQPTFTLAIFLPGPCRWIRSSSPIGRGSCFFPRQRRPGNHGVET